ncbi:hypothetical protein DM01DRAFT_1117962 [Hesseltinella vesiculosa]|uniref:Uncharacterized protein n=1 Tax=Hesseltinella vesiculosa TaxID=101127 RepID=A0A1X2G9R8_9FUNG|nr:hypothetical protein DM01DRAFT_1117962 [Hesseltinella vesiculosa]
MRKVSAMWQLSRSCCSGADVSVLHSTMCTSAVSGQHTMFTPCRDRKQKTRAVHQTIEDHSLAATVERKLNVQREGQTSCHPTLHFRIHRLSCRNLPRKKRSRSFCPCHATRRPHLKALR